MVESLGKIVSQLQTLQGLTSSLKLLQTMPKEGGRASEGGRSLSEREKAVMREKGALGGHQEEGCSTPC